MGKLEAKQKAEGQNQPSAFLQPKTTSKNIQPANLFALNLQLQVEKTTHSVASD